MKAHHSIIRALLLEHEDGLNVAQIVKRLNVSADSIRHALGKMPDAYIDRWEGPRKGQYSSVWCVVEVPENCPKPSRVGARS